LKGTSFSLWPEYRINPMMPIREKISAIPKIKRVFDNKDPLLLVLFFDILLFRFGSSDFPVGDTPIRNPKS